MQINTVPQLALSGNEMHRLLFFPKLKLINEPLFDEALSITNNFLCPSNIIYMKKRKNLIIASIFCQSLGPLLYRGSTVQGRLYQAPY